MIHNVDRNTKCELTTERLVDTNCPRLESTPGEGDDSYRSTDWSAERHMSGRTFSVSGMNCLPCVVALLPTDKLYATIQRNHTAVCVEIDSPADINDAVIEMDDEPILRRRLPSTEVVAGGVEEKYIAPCTDSRSIIQNSQSFRRANPWRRVISTEQDMHSNTVKVVIMVFEPCDLLCHQRSLPPNRADTEGGASIYAHITLVHRTNFSPNETAGGRNDDYIRLPPESNQSVCGRPVTGSLCSGQVYRPHSLDCFESRTLLLNCDYQQTVVYVALDYCCSDQNWFIETYIIRSSIEVILIVWYCVGIFKSRDMASDDWADGDEAGPVMWCTVWKGTTQDCIDHMRRIHNIPLSVKAVNLAKYFPAWTISRVEWSKMLMPCISGVAIDTLLFSRAGSPLCHRYRLISRTGSHLAFRGTYLRRLWSFIDRDAAGGRQGQRGLDRRVFARMVKSTDRSVSRGRRPRRLKGSVSANKGCRLSERPSAGMSYVQGTNGTRVA